MSENLLYAALAACYIVLGYFAVQATRSPSLSSAASASRSAAQRKLHMASVPFALIPLLYFVWLGGPGLKVFLVLAASQILPMLALRSLRVKWRVRLSLMPWLAALSAFIAAFALTWPTMDLSRIAAPLWATLAIAALCIFVSSVLSLYSFPLGHGERAH